MRLQPLWGRRARQGRGRAVNVAEAQFEVDRGKGLGGVGTYRSAEPMPRRNSRWEHNGDT